MGETRDGVDHYLSSWARAHPDLDTAPTAAVTRLRRAAWWSQSELDTTLSRFGLSRPAFDMLDALRRRGTSGRLAQSELLAELSYTSGTLSVRLTRLERAGLVSRRPDPDDRRGVIVELTDTGRAAVDAATRAHAATTERFLAPLGPAERDVLTALLRRLCSAAEAGASADRAATLLGAVLAPTRPANPGDTRRHPDRPRGLLVERVDADGPGARAGLNEGDVVVAVRSGTSPTTGVEEPADLARALSGSARRIVLTVVRGTGRRDVTVRPRR